MKRKIVIIAVIAIGVVFFVRWIVWDQWLSVVFESEYSYPEALASLF